MSFEVGMIPYTNGATSVQMGSVITGGASRPFVMSLANADNPTDPPTGNVYVYASSAVTGPLFMLTPQQPTLSLVTDPDSVWAVVTVGGDILQIAAT